MAYLHKLSGRTSLLRDSLTFLLPLAVGCQKPTAVTGPGGGTGGTVPVASVVVSPAAVNLTPGQTAQFTATPEDVSGNPLTGRTIMWMTSNVALVTVSATGLVTGLAAGADTVTATSEGKSGHATVTVATPPPVPVALVVVSPAAVNLTPGQTAQLTATPEDASGNPLTGRTITWTTSNVALATVSATGLVTGVAAGVDTVTATSEGKSGHATVTVATLPPPPPPGSVLLVETFADGAFASRGWYDNTSLTIDSTQHIPGSVASLLIHLLPGATNPTWGAGTRHLFTATPTLYVSYWIKHSASWVGSGLNYDPHMFHILSTLDAQYAGPAAAFLDALLEENYHGSSTGSFGRVTFQDARNINTTPTPPWSTQNTENRSVAGCNTAPDGFPADCYQDGNPYTGWNNGKVIETPTATFTDPSKTGWHHVEIYLAMNSIVGGIGQLDGIVRYWLDGVLQMEHTNVLFRTGQRATMQFQQLLIAPYFGSGSPVDQTLWVDSLMLATSHP